MKSTLKDLSGQLANGSVESNAPISKSAQKKKVPQSIIEDGGPTGPEPTRYGDWERNGIAKDF